jgi:hypothetical protein
MAKDFHPNIILFRVESSNLTESVRPSLVI